MVRLAPFGRYGEAGSAFASCADSSDSAAISFTAAMLAETPRWVRLECASRPVTVTRKEAMPLWPTTGCMLVGSPTMTAAGRGRCANASISRGAPRHPISSSYEKARCAGRFRFAAFSSGTAASAQAINPFMSADPRP